MIVTCPSCSARYKINDEKIKGKGAKITCLKCAHKFVVLKTDLPGENTLKEAPTPAANTSVSHTAPRADDIRHRDFREVHVTWKVRKGIGLTYDFHDLATLLEYLEDEQVDPSDHLAYDARTWTQISSIDDLEQHFRKVWDMAVAGRLPLLRIDHSLDEDEADAPTTIVRHGSNLADQIRRAVQEANEATPSPNPGNPVGDHVPGTAAPTAPMPEKRSGNDRSSSGGPDPFAGLKAKADAERKADGPSTAMMAFIGLAVVALVIVLLMGLGIIPIPFA